MVHGHVFLHYIRNLHTWPRVADLNNTDTGTVDSSFVHVHCIRQWFGLWAILTPDILPVIFALRISSLTASRKSARTRVYMYPGAARCYFAVTMCIAKRWAPCSETPFLCMFFPSRDRPSSTCVLNNSSNSSSRAERIIAVTETQRGLEWHTSECQTTRS